MSRISLVFATGDSWLDRLVTKITRSRWSHVAMRFEADGELLEALVFSGLIWAPGGKYDTWPVMQAIPVEVDPLVYGEMLALARKWHAQRIPYGYGTCVAIGLKALAGTTAGGLFLGLLPPSSADTLVCSELIVRLWRVAQPEFLAGQDARLTTPDDIFREFSPLTQNYIR